MNPMKARWCIVDAGQKLMRCERCGGTHPLSVVVGKTVVEATSVLLGFLRLHAECDPGDKK